MQIVVRFFATLRDRAGREKAQLELPDGATVQLLMSQIAKQFPKTEEALETALIAVNHEYAFPEEELADGDEVALFPPVSGGSDTDPPQLLAITHELPKIDDVITDITLPETGAVCVFTGTVRGVTNTDEGSFATDALHYDAYIPMAENKLAQVATEIRERWSDVQGIALIQRIGELKIGEITVLAACSSGHRDDGCFEGARYGIDRLKEIVPVWKKEIGPDGDNWVEGHYRPTREDK